MDKEGRVVYYDDGGGDGDAAGEDNDIGIGEDAGGAVGDDKRWTNGAAGPDGDVAEDDNVAAEDDGRRMNDGLDDGGGDDKSGSRDDFDSVYARPEIDRGPLRDLLLDSLLPGTVVWDCHLLGLVPEGDGWKLAFKNGETATADIVIGADGSSSKVRPFVTSVKNHYAGTIILQGNVAEYPSMQTLLNGGKIHVFADGKFLHISSKGDGSIDFYISVRKEEDWVSVSGIDFSDRSAVVAWFRAEFEGWSELWLGLVERAGLPLLLRPQYCMPLDQRWETKANITLLGDAAHLMPPSGEGVNLAMLDALELCEVLTDEGYDDMKTAIADYEKRMQERGIVEAKVSIDMVEWMHGEHALEKMVELLGG